MHICLKCKRIIIDIKEIENGCNCGSKIFIYKKDSDGEKLQKENFYLDIDFELDAQDENSSKKIEEDFDDKLKEPNSIVLAEDVKIVVFNQDEVENIRQIQKGVFEVNLFSLQNDPVVVKDEDEVYYVRLPFENKNFKHQK